MKKVMILRVVVEMTSAQNDAMALLTVRRFRKAIAADLCKKRWRAGEHRAAVIGVRELCKADVELDAQPADGEPSHVNLQKEAGE